MIKSSGKVSVTLLFVVLAAGVGYWLGYGTGQSGQTAGDALKHAGFKALSVAMKQRADRDTERLVLLENPELIDRISEGGAFGGEFSRDAAQNMFSRYHHGAIEDVKDKTSVQKFGEGSWLVRMPIVNAAFFETRDGLVVVDTGMAPAGPALLKAIRSVSQQPIHTIIYTHGHVDHAYGTWPLIEDSPNAEVIAHEALPARFERYIRLRGSLARYMSQPVDQLPQTREDLVWPTRTFADRLELSIGGETFVLQHHRGETDDQLYVWVPGRKVLASADYYQGFLPNAGNGKRVQRYVEDWVTALREMAALEPAIVLPAHGDALTDPEVIQENFQVLVDALDHVVQHTLAGLNAALPRDQIFQSVALPEHLANHPSLNVQYVTPADISKMLIKQYAGWWDDVPSNWSPAPLSEQGQKISELAGGIDKLAAEAVELSKSNVWLACHLADWAWEADRHNPSVQSAVIAVYKARILHPESNTQEILEYVRRMGEARALQLATEG